MKTLLIYNPIDEPLKYAILDGDHSDVHGAFINGGINKEKERAACNLLFSKTGDYLIELTEDVSLVESKNWDKVAVVTFLP